MALPTMMMTFTIGKYEKRAFTLIETVIVLAIITMFFAVSIPLFSRLVASAKLGTSARSVTSALRTAREYAISRNSGYGVFFETDIIYYIYYTSGGSDVVIDKKYKLPTGITFSTIEFTDKKASFKSTGELDLDEAETDFDKSVTITDTSSITISVEKTTGRVKID